MKEFLRQRERENTTEVREIIKQIKRAKASDDPATDSFDDILALSTGDSVDIVWAERPTEYHIIAAFDSDSLARIELDTGTAAAWFAGRKEAIDSAIDHDLRTAGWGRITSEEYNGCAALALQISNQEPINRA